MKNLTMPSGTDYGMCIRSGQIDKCDFILALFFKDSKYKWVIEHKSGELIHSDDHTPLHPTIFGVDEGDWFDWVNGTAFPKVDAWIESKVLKNDRTIIVGTSVVPDP